MIYKNFLSKLNSGKIKEIKLITLKIETSFFYKKKILLILINFRRRKRRNIKFFGI